MSLAAAILFSTLIATIGNPACAHHAGLLGPAHADAARAAGHAGHDLPDEQEPGHGHEDQPCNCPAQCQVAGTAAAIEPAYRHLPVPQTLAVSFTLRRTLEPAAVDPPFLHPFANAPPRI